MLTRTWFHTGAYFGRDRVSNYFAGLLDDKDAGEYYREPGLTDAQAKRLLLDDTVLPKGLTVNEEREACRTLKGAMLRQEVYALDGTSKQPHPYSVTEQNFTIQLLQPQGHNPHAVFFSHPREAISHHYERNPAEPRTSHALTLEVDGFGNVMKSLAIGYGRRTAANDPALTDGDKARQTRLLITLSENDFTNPVLEPDQYRTPLPAETRTSELSGFKPENNAARFSFDEWTHNDFALLASAADIPYEETADNIAKQKRLIEHVRTRYRNDDLTALLPPGVVGALALPGESYKLALTPGLVARIFTRKKAGQPDEDLLPNPAPLLQGKGEDEGGYIASDGNWWIPSGRAFFDPDAAVANPASTAAQELSTARQHFYLPRKIADPFGHSTVMDYDDPHDLLVTRTSDSLGNTIAAANDYRVLQPRIVTDPNQNRVAVAFDALGMVVATAVMGKAGENVGDQLADFDADPPLADLQAFIANPHAQAAALLGKATTRIVYDLARFQRAGQPPVAATLARETHCHEPGGAQTKIQFGFTYSDGFGRELQQKIRAEAGDAPQRQPDVHLPTGDIRPGSLILDDHGNPVLTDTAHRWVGTGRTVFNNKGKPVRQYEPFFSAAHSFEDERMTDTGVSPVLFYDPVERVVATLHPNHTYEKVVFDPWRQDDLGRQRHGRSPSRAEAIRTWAGHLRRLARCRQPATWQALARSAHRQRVSAPERDAAQRPPPTPIRPRPRTWTRSAAPSHHRRQWARAQDSQADPPVEGSSHPRRTGHRRQPARSDRREGPRRHALRLRHARQPHPSGQHGSRRALDAQRRGGQAALRAGTAAGHVFRTEYDVLRRPLGASCRREPQHPATEILMESKPTAKGNPTTFS